MARSLFLWLYLFHHSYNSLGLLAHLGGADWKLLGVFSLQMDCLVYVIPGYLSVVLSIAWFVVGKGTGWICLSLLGLLLKMWAIHKLPNGHVVYLCPTTFMENSVMFLRTQTTNHNNFVLFCLMTICSPRSIAEQPHLVQCVMECGLQMSISIECSAFLC